VLLKSDRGYVQFVDENGPERDWQFTVICRNGEVGLIVPISLRTGEVIELGQRIGKCIFVKPEEYADLIEELEIMRDNYEQFSKMSTNDIPHGNDPAFLNGWQRGINYALQLIAQRANPPIGVE
jgi:hypothetical protein